MNLTEIKQKIEFWHSQTNLTIHTQEEAWQCCFTLAHMLLTDSNSIETIKELKRCLNILVPKNLPIPRDYTSNEGKSICLEAMFARLSYMIEMEKNIKNSQPMSSLTHFKQGLSRYLWDAIRRHSLVEKLPNKSKEKLIQEVAQLEYELATLEYDSTEFFEWEMRYKELIESSNNLLQNISTTTEEPTSAQQYTPWQWREILSNYVKIKPAQEPTKNSNIELLEYRKAITQTTIEDKRVITINTNLKHNE